MADKSEYGRIKIAIVDNDNLFCQQVQSELESTGFQVDYDRNVQKGLARIKRWRPHVVVSDFHLSGMDYFDFAAEVEQLVTKTALVVVSSKHLDASVLMQLTGLSHVSLTFQKPVRVEDLTKSIVELVQGLDVFQEVQEPEEIPEESSNDFGLDDLAIQREVARLEFEGKELPRFLKSLKAMSEMARSQPHKTSYFQEALEKSRHMLESVQRQNLAHLLEPLERINGYLSGIREDGCNPALEQWDLLFDDLDRLLAPGSTKVGSAALSGIPQEPAKLEDEQTSETIELPIVRSAQLQSPITMVGSHTRVRFMIIGSEFKDRLLNLGSSFNVTSEFIDDPQQLTGIEGLDGFDLLLLCLPATVVDSRAIELITYTHDRIQSMEGGKEISLVVISESESMHARIVTSHLPASYFVLLRELLGDKSLFLALISIARAGTPPMPVVLIVDSDISSSEELLRELSRQCKKVDVLDDTKMLLEQMGGGKPDLVVIRERSSNVSGIDACRAIKKSVEYRGVLVILEIEKPERIAISGGVRSGADGIICGESTAQEKAELILSLFNRRYQARMADIDMFSDRPLNLPDSVKDALGEELQTAISSQLPLSVCIVDVSGSGLTGRDIGNLWAGAVARVSPDARGFSHSISESQVLLSAVGLRKVGGEYAVQALIENFSGRTQSDAQSPTCLSIRCYPDDALTLSDLLKVDA